MNIPNLKRIIKNINDNIFDDFIWRFFAYYWLKHKLTSYGRRLVSDAEYIHKFNLIINDSRFNKNHARSFFFTHKHKETKYNLDFLIVFRNDKFLEFMQELGYTIELIEDDYTFKLHIN